MPSRAAAARQEGMDEEMVAKSHNFRDSDLPDKLKWALDFAERYLVERGYTIDDEFMAGMKEHWTEPQIVEIAIGLGSWEAYHKFNNAFDVDPPVDGIYETGAQKVPAEMRQHLEFMGVK